MPTSHSRSSLPPSGSALARRTALGIGLAVVAVLLVQAIVDGVGLEVGADGPMSPFAAGPLVGTTVVSGAAAAVVYAGLIRFTDRPVRNFVAVAVAVFVLQLAPVFALAPALGVTPAGQAVLVVHTSSSRSRSSRR